MTTGTKVRSKSARLIHPRKMRSGQISAPAAATMAIPKRKKAQPVESATGMTMFAKQRCAIPITDQDDCADDRYSIPKQPAHFRRVISARQKRPAEVMINLLRLAEPCDRSERCRRCRISHQPGVDSSWRPIRNSSSFAAATRRTTKASPLGRNGKSGRLRCRMMPPPGSTKAKGCARRMEYTGYEHWRAGKGPKSSPQELERKEKSEHCAAQPYPVQSFASGSDFGHAGTLPYSPWLSTLINLLVL